MGHPALLVPWVEVRRQVRLVSTLPLPARSALARESPLLSLRAQRRLVADPRVSVRRCLASNPSLLPSLQLVLASDTNQYVRRALAASDVLAAPAAELLVGDGNEYVRSTLAQNRSLSPELLDRLSSDPEDRVVRSVCSNPSTSGGTLERLFSSGDERFRLLASWNPATPLTLLLPLPASRFRLDHLERRFGSDPRWETISVLSRNWAGSLGDLLLASGVLHPLP